MRMIKINFFRRFLPNGIIALAALLSGAAGLTSCSAVFDDLEECPRGVIMRFVFDYNLEFANAFYSQVDCLTVYIFDEEGNLVERRFESGPQLKDEDWRMTFDLPAGKYKAIAYGGMDCEEASFVRAVQSEDLSSFIAMGVTVNESHIGTPQAPPSSPLHDHFYGMKEFMVSDDIDYDKVKLEMMRNTNHLRIVLQHLDNSPVDYKDFKFEITDDNTKFDYLNNIMEYKEVTYTPWSSNNAFAGINGLPAETVDEATRASSGQPVQVAYAELSLSRLVYDSHHQWVSPSDGILRKGPRLKITGSKDGNIVADIPLNNYLLLMKSDYFSQSGGRPMGDQEYLDRSYRHNLVFFLNEHDVWVRMNIVVDDWVVKINNIEY